tara:strand:+ start:35 stop:142 length:108 start_codon:yes stop_codon:yes gene_type:complete
MMLFLEDRGKNFSGNKEIFTPLSKLVGFINNEKKL